MTNPAKIEVIVDTTVARAQIAALQNSLRGINSAAITTANGANQAGSSLTRMGAAAANSNSQMSGLSRGFNSILTSIGSINPALGGLTGRIGAFGGQLGGITGRLGGLATGMGGVAMAGAALAVALPIVAIGALAGKIFEATAQVQTFKASLTTVMGDAVEAGKAFDALAAFAAKTPFTLDQAVKGFTKLTALGLNPSERAMASYGNTAAAMGKNLNDMVEAVADATTGEFERLKEFGIKSKSEGNKVAFTFQGVTTTVGKNSQEIQDYLMKIGETNFAGGMENQAKTLSGAMSTLSDTIFMMFASLGEGDFADGAASAIEGIATVITQHVQPALQGMMSFLSGMFTLITAVPRAVIDAFSSVLPAGKDVGTMGEWIGVIFEGLGAIAEAAGAVIGYTFKAIFGTIKFVAEGVASIWNWAFGETEKASKNSAAAQDKDSAWASTRMIDRVRGFIAGFKEYVKKLPEIFWTTINTLENIWSVFWSKLLTGDWGSIGDAIAEEFKRGMGKLGKIAVGINNEARTTALDSYANRDGKKSDYVLGGDYKALDPTGEEAKKDKERKEKQKKDEERHILRGTTANPDLEGLSIMRGIAAKLGMTDVTSSYRKGAVTARGTTSDHARGMALDFDTQYARTNPKLWGQFLSELGKAGFIINPKQLSSINSQGDHANHAHVETDGRWAKGKGKSATENMVDDAKSIGEREAKLAEYLVGLEKAADLSEQKIESDTRTLAIAESISKAQEIANRDLSAAEKASITTATERGLQAQGLKTINEQIASVEREAAADANKAMEIILYGEEEAEAMAKRRAVIEGTINDLKKKGVNIDDPAVAARLANLESLLKQADEGSFVNRYVSSGRDFEKSQPKSIEALGRDHKSNLDRISEYFNEQRGLIKDGVDAEKQRLALAERQRLAVLGAGEEFKEKVGEASDRFLAVGDQISGAIGQLLGQKAGAATSGVFGIIDMFKSAKGGSWGQGDFSQSASPVARLSDGIKKLTGATGKLGSALGGMSAGAEMGAMVAPLGKMLWSKFSSTGAQVGGAIGSFAGPLGSLAGSIIGGTIGGLLKKTKKASQQFNFEDGKLVAGNLSGNSSKFKAGAAGAGSSVISSLYSIAEKLGADLQSVNMASIGIRDGKWRVDADGSGDTKKKKGAIDFGKDGESAAVRYVIADALKKGILTGLSSFADRIMRTATDGTMDAMVSLASEYESMLRDLAKLKDPLTAGAQEITSSLDKMAQAMRSAGATSDELAKVEEYRSLKLTSFLEEQMSGLTDFRKALDGEGSGVTKLNQLAAKQAEFDAMRSKVAAGDTVDQSKFTSIGQEIFSLARDIYGTSTSEFQAIRQDLIGVTDTAINNVQSQYDEATRKAIESQAITSQTTATNTAIANDYLAQLVAMGGFGSGIVQSSGGFGGRLNDTKYL